MIVDTIIHLYFSSFKSEKKCDYSHFFFALFFQIWYNYSIPSVEYVARSINTNIGGNIYEERAFPFP